ncbi:hypothetical protein [Henriciella marina]|uniref:Uncharacterized protein n=1 Tax=Henriciella marina TaxID=453851 RepID=A0ABT4LUC8_9PROT|nr:hypothetical protein [Henriciella marina]MCZ4297803.1 hypothetical protein [Henriciella marina]
MNWLIFVGIAAFVIFDIGILFYLLRKANRPGGLHGRSGSRPRE